MIEILITILELFSHENYINLKVTNNQIKVIYFKVVKRMTTYLLTYNILESLT